MNPNVGVADDDFRARVDRLYDAAYPVAERQGCSFPWEVAGLVVRAAWGQPDDEKEVHRLTLNVLSSCDYCGHESCTVIGRAPTKQGGISP